MQWEMLLCCWGLLSTLVTVAGLSCSWSNEGCHRNEDCCSRSCWQAHEGTNARCRHSTLGEPCVFSYHCGDDLDCDKNHYNCCSPFWKACTRDLDCCEPQHVCRPAEGFIYHRCLMPSGAPSSSFLPSRSLKTSTAAVTACVITVGLHGLFLRLLFWTS